MALPRLRTLLAALAAAIVSTAVLVPLAFYLAMPPLPDVAALADYRPRLPIRVYSADRVLLAEYGEKRSYVPVSGMPRVMRDAVLAAEDARFFAHGGMDWRGLARAALANVGSVGSQGASTITMQVAKKFYLSSEKTFLRKACEALLTMRIESRLSKEQILDLYMNQIFLGQRAFGFAAAAEVYFGKPLAQLSLAEAAMLAGLPKAPSRFNPIVNPARAMLRQRYVLGRMLDNGFITRAEYDAAKAEVLHYRSQAEVPQHAQYAAELARQALYDRFGDEASSRGFEVELTLKADQQEAAYRALRRGILDYERRQPYRGPEARVALPASAADRADEADDLLAPYPDNDELQAAIVTAASPQRVEALLRTGDAIAVTGDGLRPVAGALAADAAKDLRIEPGAVVRVVRDGAGRWTVTQQPQVEGAFVALDPDSGAIASLVGGFDFDKSAFNHATQAWRQPGSSIKPFIYSAALEKGFTPMTVVDDEPLHIVGTGNAPAWEPRNADGRFDGPIPVHEALARSKNLVAIRVLQAIGVPYAQQWIGRFGLDPDRQPPYLTLALGAGSVTPLQLAAGYAVFANGGYRVPPVLIRRIRDARGQLLAEVPLPDAPAPGQRVIDARNAFVMTQMLQEVTRPGGSAPRVQSTLRRTDVQGKTGTTNDAVDAWFAGFQRHLVAVSWIGYDTPRSLGRHESGGGVALPVWLDYMGQALRKAPVDEPPLPPGVVNVDGAWAYEEYVPGAGGSRAPGTDTPVHAGALGPSADAPDAAERRSILDLFRR
ncbi:penicillin-binding protein 1A [Xylophilus sp.]|uniref:penicillin-binding protein 1A n=1 Tax=Xylophilus sp. TaxID=2653893 RepID=UPI0013B9CB45|nr:PBP1A family penicillin-binding protein [Xylophilus sp.]KAF1048697.1 MAG: Penicillin-binding protein 1A [Xylophilus sp.]